MIDERIIKVKLLHGKDRDGRKYPFNFLEYCPPGIVSSTRSMEQSVSTYIPLR